MTGIIILAAGESARLGRPKQLLPWGDADLLARATKAALDAQVGPVVVVLGAVDCRESLEGMPVTVVLNEKWASGMGGSIVSGMKVLQQDSLDSVIVMLCDQPFVTTTVLRNLVDQRSKSDCEVVVSGHADVLGPPVLFSSSRFAQLMKLDGLDGAKSIIRNESSLAVLDCPESAVDVDTAADWEAIAGKF